MAGIKDGAIDLTRLRNDDYINDNNNLWVKCDIDEKIYLWDQDKNGAPEPYILFKFSDSVHPVNKGKANSGEVIRWLINALRLAEDPAKPKPIINNNQNNANEQKANNFCENIDKAIDEILQNMSAGLDISATNTFGWQPAAMMPTSAIVPLKSNLYAYGPYASPNFGSSFGGTKVEVDTDLCPWVFGSLANMHTAGQSIVQNSNIGLIRAESGSVTVPGLPNIASLGSAIGGGPNLSAINVSFGGSAGITTQYTFRTYTPKFGGLSRLYTDKFKEITKNKQQFIKYLRDQSIKRLALARKSKQQEQIQNIAVGGDRGGAHTQKSLQRVLAGEFRDGITIDENTLNQQTKVGIDTLHKSSLPMLENYEKNAYMSLDGLFGPISLYGDGGLPRYASFDPYNKHNSSPILPHPPFTAYGDCSTQNYKHDQYNLEITQKYSNPLTNKFSSNEHHHSGPGYGNNIELLGRGTDIPEKGPNRYASYYLDDEDRESPDYRFLGMRGPLVLHSWGYDLQGKPIPNEADDEYNTKSGAFKSDGLKDRFLSNWLQKPATWPVAPVDLRFDRARGVWVSPQPYKIVVLKVIKTVEAFGTGKGVLVNSGPLYDKDGNTITPDTSVCCDGPTGPTNPQQQNWIDVITNVCLTSEGLVIKKRKVRVLDTEDCTDFTIETTNCPDTTPTNPSPTPTPTPCVCPEPSGPYGYDDEDGCSPGSSSSQGLVTIVDKIGHRHKAGTYVYAYYDTSDSVYIVLQS